MKRITLDRESLCRSDCAIAVRLCGFHRDRPQAASILSLSNGRVDCDRYVAPPPTAESVCQRLAKWYTTKECREVISDIAKDAKAVVEAADAQ